MFKEIKQIISTNFTEVVQELERFVQEGFSVVKDGDARPYHMVLGNFIITLERMVEKKEDENQPVEEPVVTLAEEPVQDEVVQETEVKPSQPRKGKK